MPIIFGLKEISFQEAFALLQLLAFLKYISFYFQISTRFIGSWRKLVA